MPVHQSCKHHPCRSVFKGRDGWKLLPILFFLVALGGQLVAPTGPVSAQIPKGDFTIELETIASGLTAPLGVSHARDGSGRLFIYEQTGLIHIVEAGVLLPAPFLDISSKIVALNPFFDERGLIGLAFHPDYKQNGRFFVRYSAPRDGDPSEPCFGTSRGCHREVLAEYSVSGGDPNLADPSSEIILFTVDEPQFNHDAGEVAFGPDGFLYFSLGDGGGAHDGLADIPPSHGPIGHGQNIETALGAILRIDVDSPPELPLNYAIPDDNPFVGVPGLDEIYAYGLRNPYRFSFDDGPGGDGRLFLADVGQNLREEVNIVEKGGNYGWVIREGLSCFDPFNPLDPPLICASTGPLGEPLIDPIVDYSHAEGGISVIGGFVYRGSSSPELLGTYVFGDFSAQFVVPSGRLYFLVEPAPGSFEIREFQIGVDDDPYGLFLKGFGEDEDGEIYVCGSSNLAPTGSSGIVQRIVSLATAQLDIKPGSCPNPFNVKLFDFDDGIGRKGGVLPVAIHGGEDFDATDIDISSIRLEGVAPLTRGRGPKVEDLGSPSHRVCDCLSIPTREDSHLDLNLKFSAQEIASAISPGAPKEERVLTLTGTLLDGTPFELEDCIVFVGRRTTPDGGGGSIPVLRSAAPNPFNPVTRISYYVPDAGRVALRIYNVRGELVETLVDGMVMAGDHIVTWDAKGVSSGIYFYRLTTGEFRQTRKMILLK